MQWGTHIQFGLETLWLWQLAPAGAITGHLPVVIACSAMGALLPDLDAAESKIKHLSIMRVKPFMLPAMAAHRQWGHRGFTHSVSALAALVPASLLLVPWLGWQGAVALLLGYASHLVADACTKTGIPILYPRRKRYWLLPAKLRVVTGSQSEEIVFALLSVSVIAYLLLHLPFAS